MIVNRWVQASAVLLVMGDSDWKRGALIYPLRDLLGSVLWLGSYGGDRFFYRGQVYRLLQGGRIASPEQTRSRQAH
jgi:ceramide glucosyltransferase